MQKNNAGVPSPDDKTDASPISAKTEGLLCALASALFPVSVVLYFYTRNADQVRFNYVLIFCALIAASFFLLYIIANRVFGSPSAAAVFCVILWVGCWLSEIGGAFLSRLFAGLGSPSAVFLAVAAAFASLAALLLRRIKYAQAATLLLSVLISVLFLVNLFGAVFLVGKSSGTVSEDELLFKQNFTAQPQAAKQPNIYWFHCDGMLGFDAFEECFGDDQSEFASQLKRRGFAVNRKARFEVAHKTIMAIPALMCPAFYDDFIADKVTSYEKALQAVENADVQEALAFARVNNELITALEQTGGKRYFIAQNDIGADWYFPSRGTTETSLRNAELHRLSDFLKIMAYPFSRALDRVIMPDNYDYSDFPQDYEVGLDTAGLKKDILLTDAGVSANGELIDKLAYTFTQPSPKINVIFSVITHVPFLYDESGNVIGDDDTYGIEFYPATHRYFTAVLINMIDLILENDPDAVIVLQADHGLHCATQEEILEAFDGAISPELLWNYVMSAVRVPEEFQTEDYEYAASNPLNISRYIVNTFVGQNYEYLTD